MKSAIGIGALLLDGLGDTIRVSLTEDPELEIEPCRKLAGLGSAAIAETGEAGVEFAEVHRDTHVFTRRVGRLPEQREGDTIDYRPLLHRDGSVLCAVDPAALGAAPDATFRALGAKLVVGMPFKDLATSDSILLDAPPAEGDGAEPKA